MHLLRRMIPAVGLALALLVLGASRPPAKPCGEPDAPGRISVARVKSAVKTPCPTKSGASLTRRGMTAKAEAARATSRPTRLDPLMAL